MGWTHVLTIPALLALGVVYGTDMFWVCSILVDGVGNKTIYPA